MNCLTDIINNPVTQFFLAPVKVHLGHLMSCPKYVADMRTNMAKLNDIKEVVEDRKNRNVETRCVVPSPIIKWLKDVTTANGKVQDIPIDGGNCFDLINRYKFAMKALQITVEISEITDQHSLLTWTDDVIPIGRIDSRNASTSRQSSDQYDFRSRQQTFTKALDALGPNHKSHMVALWGMGGVGKTTIMKKLKKVAEEKIMFKYIVLAVIGQKTDPTAIQEVVASYLGIEIKGKDGQVRSDELRKGFEAKSGGGKNRFLIILDDVWQPVDMEDIGLSPLPNQGVDFKVLLTSRDKDVCTVMGVEVDSVLNVGLLMKEESQSLFRQYVQNYDPELQKIGDDIVSKCCGLPIAIQTIACTLKGKRKDTWMNTLARLQHHDVKTIVGAVFETSYNNILDKEIATVFLLCGLFPEDFDIPTEELMRYGWGLKLFKGVDSIREARYMLNTWMERLMHANLLLESDDVGCVKMHDLVHAFVLDMFSKPEQASIVNHGRSKSWWPADNDMRDSCKRISLTCKGMSEFPKDVKFQNLSILKLMHGDRSLDFPQDMYAEMEKLEVMSFEKMDHILIPSPQCSSTNLRVLHLHQCSLMFDCSTIGNLLNLEVLSFAKSGIEWLPSTIGNLKKLRMLDLTDCVGLGMDDGVLKELVKLEELYMRVANKKAINFTDDNCNEVAERSKSLTALEFEFFENNAQPNNMSFENLERFRIAMGRFLDEDYSKSKNSFENTLQLVTNISELSESGVNELIKRTEVLFLTVKDMYDLEDVEVKPSLSPLQSSSFNNLRVLVVSACYELTHLFTLSVAEALSKLEHLEVEESDNMEVLIHTESSGEETITFPKLKFLSLLSLENLSGLCDNVNTIELPELVELRLGGIPKMTSIYPTDKLATSCFFKEEVVIPKLEILDLDYMVNLKEIWPYEFSTSQEVKLKEIEVRDCDKLVNLFPCNPMPLLCHLKELQVVKCNSIEVLFNIDLGCVVDNTEEVSSSLRKIQVEELEKLREVWRIKGENKISGQLIRGFQAVETLTIKYCESFGNIMTPTNTNLDLGSLTKISVNDCEDDKIDILSKEETSEVNGSNSNIVFSSYHLHSVRNLRTLELWGYGGMEVVFEMDRPTRRELATMEDNQQRLLTDLKELHIAFMHKMSHVWKCNWNAFFTHQNQQSESPFHNLTIIHVIKCKSIKYLLSPLMAKLLSNLKKIEIGDCDDMEEIVSNRDDENEETSTSTDKSTTLFPRLDSLIVRGLKNLKHIGGGGVGFKCGSDELSFNKSTTTIVSLDQLEFSQVDGVSWTLCQYSREIEISGCDTLSSAIPSSALGQMQNLQVLKIHSCDSIKEVFETRVINDSGFQGTNVDEGTSGAPEIPRLNNAIMLKLPNLKRLDIDNCGCLEYMFTFSTLASLGHLEELAIKNCMSMKVIVNEKHEERTTSKVVVFRRLKSIAMVNLPNLMGFFLGMNEFRWPLLDDATIKDCPQMMVFTSGQSTAAKLKYIQTALGKHSLDHGLNFHATTTSQQTPFSSLDGRSSLVATSEGIPWSFRSLINLHVEDNASVNKKIFPSNELLQLQQLETIQVISCDGVEEVFEVLEAGTNGSGPDGSQKNVVKLPNLTEVDLYWLSGLRYIWRSNQWALFEFPSLTRVSIKGCDRLEHVFTSSMVGSLLQLQELRISGCENMEVIVEDASVFVQEEDEEEYDAKKNEIVLPCLKSLIIELLPCLKGFCLGREDFSLPLLDTMRIKKCPAIKIFTKGHFATPELKEIETGFRLFCAGEDINSLIETNQEEFEMDTE